MSIVVPASIATCPRCGQAQAEAAIECPACGVILAKARPLGARACLAHVSASVNDAIDGRERGGTGETQSEGEPEIERGRTLLEHVRALLFDDERSEPIGAIGRSLLWILLLLGTWTFATASIASNRAGRSWLHLVDLVFHEAGHILFAPFGTFLMTLGGSLLQLVVPAVAMIAFLTKSRDPFGAAVAWWWLGENLVDLAPYIADARSLQLVLLGGKTGAEVEGHDWERILTMLGWLHLDGTLARLAHGLGSLIMISALGWGLLLLLAQWRRARTAPATIVE